MDVEVMSMETLEKTHNSATDLYDREHVTSYILSHPDDFKIGHMGFEGDMSKLKLSVDYEEDLNRVRILVQALGDYCELDDIISYLGIASSEIQKLFNYP